MFNVSYFSILRTNKTLLPMQTPFTMNAKRNKAMVKIGCREMKRTCSGITKQVVCTKWEQVGARETERRFSYVLSRSWWGDLYCKQNRGTARKAGNRRLLQYRQYVRMSKREPIVSGGIGLIARVYASEKGTGYRLWFGERGKFPKEDRRKAPGLNADENTKIVRGAVWNTVCRRCQWHANYVSEQENLPDSAP